MSLRKEKQGCEPGARRARVWQGACWGGLLLIQIFLLHCLDTEAAQTMSDGIEAGIRQLEVRSEWYSRESDCPVPSESYHSEEDGQEYERISWEIVREVLPERMKTVEQVQILEQVEGMTPIPQTASFEVTDEGRTGNAQTRAESVTVLKEVWSTDFSFPVTFHSCDAEYCQLGDRMIPYREEKPEFEGQEYLLLDIIGAPRDQYRVIDVRWDGEVYQDEAGIPCRNAVASGEKLLRDYQVLYRGTARFPSAERWQTVTIYELPREETVTVLPESASGVPNQGGAGEEDNRSDREIDLPLWEKVFRTVRVIVSLLLPLILIFAFILVKKRKACYTGQKDRKTEPHRRSRKS